LASNPECDSGAFAPKQNRIARGYTLATRSVADEGSSAGTRRSTKDTTMQTDIHPQYTDTTVKCSCGNVFTTKSTGADALSLELCNECHPFFTGKQKLVDSGGRVERFNKRYGERKGAPSNVEE
jgi:large subunit ribosomal protein L31